MKVCVRSVATKLYIDSNGNMVPAKVLAHRFTVDAAVKWIAKFNERHPNNSGLKVVRS